MRIMMMDFKPRKTTPSIFYRISRLVFKWTGGIFFMLFLGLMMLDCAILALRLIKVLS